MAKTFNQDLASEVRVAKVGPYTITPIGGPKEYALWKEQQAAKQRTWEEQAQSRYMLKKASALSILAGEKSPTPDYAAEVQKRFEQGQQRQAALYAESLKNKSNTEPKKSLSERLLNWFLNIKS